MSFVLVCPTQMKISIAWGWRSAFWRRSTLECPVVCSALAGLNELWESQLAFAQQVTSKWNTWDVTEGNAPEELPVSALREHWCHVLMKMSIVLPHLQQAGKASSGPESPQTQSFLENTYCLLAFEVATCVYDTALLLVLKVYKSRLFLN